MKKLVFPPLNDIKSRNPPRAVQGRDARFYRGREMEGQENIWTIYVESVSALL
jgi:hypothetical protein